MRGFIRSTRFILFVLLLFFSISAYGQVEQSSRRVEVYFDCNNDAVDSAFGDNGRSLATLSSLLQSIASDSLLTLSRVEISSYSSPDGDKLYNERLSKRRSASLYNYLTSISVPDSLIVEQCFGVDWDGLETLVSASDMPYRDDVLEVLRSVPEETWGRVNPDDRWLSLVDSRNKHLMDLKYGDPYRYVLTNIYPQLRRGSVVTVYFKTTLTPVVEEVVPEPIQTPIPEPTPEPTEETPAEPTITTTTTTTIRKPLKFALKTNLLYDLLLTPNVELEVPIKDRFSVAGEWIFPWWTTKDNGYALQVLSGQLEGRYWFGDRANKSQLTGWFASLYAGGGLYDLQWKNNGYQGEFYIASGLGGGYAHTINRKGNLRMEYSLGFGYLKTNYRYYEGVENNTFLVWQHNGNYTWVGPTKAKVSLVWFIDWQRGGRR